MKLKVTTTYHDRKEDIDIAAGTIIERDEERAKILIGAKVAEEYVEETAEEVAEEVLEETPEEVAEEIPEEASVKEKPKGRKKTNPK
ncbi:hypothetical protein [uncultured Eubacterium sp.]|uniref:hypothetical protein n=1 Tax=uncultured Eubacterium sp. TaxID=165185 RepID=UPI0025E5AD6A|nr:hypothetical protein [uncultured Eubacterium sp.]